MKNLIDFLKNFLKNEGHFVFVSLMIAKICAFLGSILIIKLLPVSEFGVISIVGSVFAIFAPFNGFGNPQSLLRFGAVLSDNNSKVELANFLFRKGFFSQIILSILFLLCSVFYYQKYQDVVLVFVFFAIRLMGVFFQAHIQSELRINDKNRIFAKMNNIQNISTLLLMLVLCYYFGLMGYLVAVCISPFISLYWMDGFRLKNNSFNLNISVQEIRNYALHSAGTASFSDALFSLDIIILGYLLTENDVANYKVALLIPANITFLALSFMQTDFPTIAKNATNKTFLKNYIINYYKLFIPICIAIVGIGSLWRKEIFSLFFKEQYMNSSSPFVLLLIVFCLNMLFRNLYGNLNSAIGKMKFNTIASIIAIVELAILSYFLVPQFGMVGMVYSVGITLFSSGIILGIFFLNYYKRLK